MEFLDIRELVKKMINGDIQINRSMMLTSKDRTQTEKITFLGHLLKYNDIKKNNIFTFLGETIEVFNMRMKTLMKNPNFVHFIDFIKKEWNHEETILYDDNNESMENLNTVEELLENMNRSCNEFREMSGRVESNNITDILDEDDLLDSMNKFLVELENLVEHIDELTKTVESLKINLDKVNIGLLLDLSMKDKSLYLLFNETDDDKNISENIHNIFLNYIYIINLMKKQIIYYKNLIKKVKEISENMSNFMTNRKLKLKKKGRVFNLNEQQEDIQKYIDNLDD